MHEKQGTAIHAITKHGFVLAQRLQQAMPGSTILVSKKIRAEPAPGIVPVNLPLGPVLEEFFSVYACHVFVISIGAVVRMIAPFLKDKKQDPAVVCVDDAGRFAICVLSGHVGRGNEQTLKIAAALGAEPVITTASDVQGTLTVDILGRELGWTLADPEHNVTTGCAAVVNEQAVLIIQETGEPNFWPLQKKWPPGVAYTRNIETVDPSAWERLLIVSDRAIASLYPQLYAKAVVYRPKSLIVGIGCDRNTPFALLQRGIESVFREFGLDLSSVAGMASLDLKADEAGLLQVAEHYGWTFQCYSAEELGRVAGIQSPSSMVEKHTGTPSVSEAACLRLSGANELLVTKQKYGEPGVKQMMTIAISRKIFAIRDESIGGADGRTG